MLYTYIVLLAANRYTSPNRISGGGTGGESPQLLAVGV